MTEVRFVGYGVRREVIRTNSHPKVPPAEKGKRAAFHVCLQAIDFIELFGSVTGARTRTLRLERDDGFALPVKRSLPTFECR
jgi:hypothetical protein